MQAVTPPPAADNSSSRFSSTRGKSIDGYETTIIKYFLAQVNAKGGEAAIAYQNTTLTYADLDKYSLRLARALVLKGFRREQIIICRFQKSPWAILSFLGILRAGLAFTPVDPLQPDARTQHLVLETGSTLILESESAPRQSSNIESWKVDSLFFQNLAENAGVEVPEIGRSDLAYVYFTSGSTGRPKGVMVQHGAICTSLVAHGRRLDMCSTSRVLQATSYTFDPCLTEIFGTLIYGGCICIPQDLTRLGETINELAVRLKNSWIIWQLLCANGCRSTGPSSHLRLFHSSPQMRHRRCGRCQWVGNP
jgi:non-ribosomal peptide synthetase component F